MKTIRFEYKKNNNNVNTHIFTFDNNLFIVNI